MCICSGHSNSRLYCSRSLLRRRRSSRNVRLEAVQVRILRALTVRTVRAQRTIHTRPQARPPDFTALSVRILRRQDLIHSTNRFIFPAVAQAASTADTTRMVATCTAATATEATTIRITTPQVRPQPIAFSPTAARSTTSTTPTMRNSTRRSRHRFTFVLNIRRNTQPTTPRLTRRFRTTLSALRPILQRS
jgi:hypothetical protein